MNFRIFLDGDWIEHADLEKLVGDLKNQVRELQEIKVDNYKKIVELTQENLALRRGNGAP